MKKLEKDPLVDVYITEAKYTRDYKIGFKFSDGTNQEVDFKKLIENNAGGCSKYLNKSLFKKFDIVDGKDISWDDFEMSFPFIFLYEEANLELA